jgi:hypothetical protein
MEKKENQLVIGQSSVQSVLDYLAQRPFSEVHQIVPLLLKLPVVNITPATPAPMEANGETKES